MKSIGKILSRYVLSAAGVALILLLLNFAALVVWTIQSGKTAQKDYSVSQLAAGLTQQDGGYTLSETARTTITRQFQWAMLLDENGRVVWGEKLPADVPREFTVSDVAGFSRWYLQDYPVRVWRHPGGLFVLGSPKGSMWKHAMEIPQKVMDNTLVWAPALLLLNGGAAVLLALLFALRFFRSLQPLAQGIEDMAENKAVRLSSRGLLSDLAEGINQTSARLMAQEAALSRRDTARTAWIAGVSHDIRTPLSLVMGYASRLEEDPLLPPAAREQAEIIRRQSQRIKTLVSDLNLASKLTYDMQPIRQESIALPALLRKSAADFLNSGLAEAYTLDVTIAANARNTSIRGDEGLLRRAVANLIANSLGHNPRGCTIQVRLEQAGANCCLTVADDGAGFTPEQLANLNHSPDSAELPNHGLGLTIVRQIVKAHAGTMEFRNLPAGGCTVVICLKAGAGTGMREK